MDESESLTLEGIRNSLIRQEDSIIFGLLERAKYCYNEDTYDPTAFDMDGFKGSLVEYMVKGTETLHAKVKNNNIMMIKITNGMYISRVWLPEGTFFDE